MRESIKQILMRRDGNSESEADERIRICKDELYELLEEGDADYAYEVCADHFGLEPDYLDELI